ncbi:hypothetical protein M2135_002676, partial [Parabacteroides sp. PF5-9]|nr:hypothetical protein [Parabacteroides sp. PF5-9]
PRVDPLRSSSPGVMHIKSLRDLAFGKPSILTQSEDKSLIEFTLK